MKYSIENLGIAGYGSANDDWASGSFAIRPETGEEIIIHSTLEFGIVWIDVKSGRSAHLVPPDGGGVEVIAEYEDHAGGSVYRFGLCFGDDGHLYFASGTHLFRMRVK